MKAYIYQEYHDRSIFNVRWPADKDIIKSFCHDISPNRLKYWKKVMKEFNEVQAEMEAYYDRSEDND